MDSRVITPLYKREQWERWQAIFKGTKSAMLWSFDEWFQNHQKMVQDFKIRGSTVHEVEMDVDQYLAWIRTSRLPINGDTRTQFAGYILRERMKEAGDFSD